MNESFDTASSMKSIAYPLPENLDSRNLTVSVENGHRRDNVSMLPLPNEATKEHILDAIGLLEAHLSNPALNTLRSVALSWYLNMLTRQQVANLSEHMQLLIQRVAVQHPALIA